MKKLTAFAAFAACALAGQADAQQFRLEAANPIGQWSARPAAGNGGYLAVSYLHDDGASENAIGLNCGVATCNPASVDMIWAQYFDTTDPLFANNTSDTITRIDVAFGNPPGPTAPPAGTAYTVYVYDDPNDDMNPTDLGAADLKATATNTSTSPDLDVFEQTVISPSVVTGGFFVVIRMAHVQGTTPATPGVGEFPASLDQGVQSLSRAWATATATNGFNPSAPQSGLLLPWTELDSVALSGVWLVRAEGSGSGPQTFCTAKTGLVCGVPAISASGAPSATSGSGFVVSAAPARTCKSGILLYNQASINPGVSFQGGTLCVESMGLRRAGSTNSGGTPGPNCDGVFSIDMNAFALNGWVVPDCAGNPSGIPASNPAGFLTNMGTTVYTTYWGRDSVATGSFVSDALSYDVGP